MLTVIFAIGAVVCALGWFFTRLSVMTLLHFMGKKGYTMPTRAELKECSHEAAEDMFSWWPTWKDTH